MHMRTKEKPYNTLNNYYQLRYGQKVFKIALNGDFTCPNKDGSKGTGGCIYCSESGSGDFAGNKTFSLNDQFQNIKQMMQKKWKNGLYIAYFQANTNTYKDVETLRTLFEEALSLEPKIIGLSIATRCDALDDAKYDLLEELSKKTHLQIELGLQSIHQETALWMNRGHDLQCFTDAVNELRKRNIDVVVHIINGFPNETPNMMLETSNFLNNLDIQGIKIHMLHVMKKTALGHLYAKEPFNLLTLDEYRDIVVKQITHLKEDIIIHRLTGDSPTDQLIAPLWTKKKFIVMNEIDKYMRANKLHQAIYYNQKE
ncbi:MAG: TIGR01212 family radical SAM protein [Candidatus Izemoplasmataceae bacterium]